MSFEKIVIITKKTALQELVERFNTREQARFYIEHLGASFEEYQAADDAYNRSLATLKAGLPSGSRYQFVERGFLPTFLFGDRDLVVTLGPDGLVVNTAKYLQAQPVLALNPDPERIDGILVPFDAAGTADWLAQVMRGNLEMTGISMAQATLSDGQRLSAVNDLFVGQRSHVSARYRLRLGGREENQSSSGIIVSTGAGSTGWLRSVLTGASGVVGALIEAKEAKSVKDHYRFAWEADYLYFSVREPFVSKVSSADLIFGPIRAGERLEVVSQMPQNGVIFSDGVEADYLEFNSGATARIGLAERKLNLITRV